MKKFLVFLLMIVATIQLGITGLPPTTLQGLLDTVKNTTFNFFTPNKLATKVTGGTLLELNNNNLLSNPDFEHSTYTTGWTSSGTGTRSAETSALISGKKAYKVVTSSQTNNVYQDTTLYAAEIGGRQGLLSVYINNNTSGSKVCPRVNGVQQSSICITLETDGEWHLYEIPFILGSTSSGIEIDTPSSTGTLIADSAYVGLIKPGMITETGATGRWRDGGVITFGAVTTAPTKGTVVNDKMRFRQVGQNLEINYEYQQTSGGGAAGSGAYLISIPSGYFIDTTTFPSSTTIINDSLASDRLKVGEGYLNQNGGSCSTLSFYIYDSTRLYAKLGFSADCTGANSISTGAGDVWASANTSFAQNMGFRGNVSVPIAGLNSRVSLYSQQCRKPSDCENVFSAKIQNTGSASVQTESLDWIDTVTRSSAGVVAVTFKSGIFTVPPAITATIYDGVADISTELTALSTSGVTFRTFNAAGTPLDYDVSLIAQKQGADYKERNMITGSFEGIEKCADPYECTDTFSAKVSSAGVVSDENLDWINGNAAVASSVYTITFNTSLFTTAPNCVVSIGPENTTNISVLLASISSTTAVLNSFVTSTGAASPRPFIITCQKQGVDFRPKTAVAGTFIDSVTSPNAGKVALCSAKISDTGVISEQVGGCFTSCTNASPTVCSFTASYWASAPNCLTTQGAIGTGHAASLADGESTSSVNVRFAGDVKRAFKLLCHGVRQ